MDKPYCSVCTLPKENLPVDAAACAGIASAFTLGNALTPPLYLMTCLCDEHRALVAELVLMIGVEAGRDIASRPRENPEKPKSD